MLCVLQAVQSLEIIDYYKMALWMNQHLGLQPMQLTESVVYRYLSFLRETNAAPTLADATVKAIWFMHSTANIVNFNPKVFTSRIAGVRRDLYLRKRILRQAPPFPADVVRVLEEYALHAENRVDSMFTNFILFCIFSSCRIGDAAKIREVEFSRYHDIFLVEAATSEAKNTNTMERRRMHSLQLAGGCIQIPGASNGRCNCIPWSMTPLCQPFQKCQAGF